MKQRIECEDLQALCAGAALLGSGGGGDTAILSTFVTKIMTQCGSVTLMSRDELMNDDIVVPMAYIGSPAVSLAEGPTLPLFNVLLEAVKRDYSGRRLILLPAEIGGCNALTPLVSASFMGLPVLDGDLIGRAFPKVSMCKPAVNFPNQSREFYMADRQGQVMRLTANDVFEMEQKARDFTIQAGGSASIATFIFNGEQAEANVIEGSLTRALRLGGALRSQQSLNALGACLIAKGVVTALTRETVAGFLLGSVTLHTAEGDYVIAFQNEYLKVTREEAIVIQTPDIIVLLDDKSQAPVASESLCLGQTLSLISLPTPAFWKEPQAARCVSLDQFSLNPLEA